MLCIALAACSESEADPADEIVRFHQAGQVGDWAFTAQGRIESRAGLRRLGARVAGVLDSLLVDEGEIVRQGRVIARVDCREREAQVMVMEAQAAVANAQLAQLRAGTRIEDVRAGEAELTRALAFVADARSAYDKALPLHATGVASTRSLESLSASLDAARAEAARARAHFEALRNGPRQEEIDAAEATYRAALAGHRFAVALTDQCDVISPLDGEVVRVNRRPGEQVGGLVVESIVEIVDLSTLEVRAQVDERYVGQIQKDQTIEFWLEGEERRFAGRVDRVAGIMGRKTDFANASSDKADRDVREIVIIPDQNSGFPRVHGLRVVIGFHDDVNQLVVDTKR